MVSATCGDLLVCFSLLHARLRVRKTPGIPCALAFVRAIDLQDSGKACRGNAKVCLLVIARSDATKQSMFRACAEMDCFAEGWIASLRSR